MRTGELTQKLLSYYHTSEDATTNKYIAMTQVRSNGTYAESTADAIILGNWPSSGYEIEGFEIKTSRADWLNELKNPQKSERIKKYCHRWWLVISDENFVKEGELPEDWGMLAIRRGHLKPVVKAPTHEPIPPDVGFISSLMRANKKETIPIDVHNDKLKDAKREIEAELKKKYQALMDYVSFLNSGLGIELKWKEKYNYSTSDYIHKWVAIIKTKGYDLNEEATLDLIKSVITEDLESIGYRLHSAKKDAEQILNITTKALKTNNTHWGKDND